MAAPRTFNIPGTPEGSQWPSFLMCGMPCISASAIGWSFAKVSGFKMGLSSAGAQVSSLDPLTCG